MTLLANLVAGAIGVVILLTVAVVFLRRDRRRAPGHGACAADRDSNAGSEDA